MAKVRVIDKTPPAVKYWHSTEDGEYFTAPAKEKVRAGCVEMDRETWERKKKRAEVNPNGLFELSQSKHNTWKRCRLAYHRKYVEKLKRKKKSRPLMFGTIIHEMIEAYAEGDDPFERLAEIERERGPMFIQEIEAYGDIVNDARLIMTDYFKYHGDKSLKYIRREGRGAEHEFYVEIEGILVNGKIDAFARTPNKLKWLVEHKTFKSLPNEDHRWRNLQSSIYLRILDMLGWFDADGVCWDYIKSKPPTVPRILKNGTASNAATDSLPTAIAAFLKENEFDPKEYSVLTEAARLNQSSYFPRIFTPVKKNVVDILFREFMITAHEIEEMHGKRMERTIDKHCDWCDYEPLCRAEFTGSDVDYIIEKEYTSDGEQLESSYANQAE